MNEMPRFAPGRNIAMKVPPHLHEATVHFYRVTLGFEEVERQGDSVGFRFGSSTLWIDRVPGLSQAEVWLEVRTNDPDAAAAHLAAAGIVRCDAIEPLPEGLHAFWIANPASIIHLVCDETEGGPEDDATGPPR